MEDIEHHLPASRSPIETGARGTVSHRSSFEESDELAVYLNDLVEGFDAIALSPWVCSDSDISRSIRVISWTDFLASQNNLTVPLSPAPLPESQAIISFPRSTIAARRSRIQFEQAVVLLNLVVSTALGVGVGIATSRLDTGFSVGTGSLAVLALAQRVGFSHSRRID